MTGNQVRELLRLPNIDKLLAVLPPSKEVDAMRRVMCDLALIMSHADNSVKTDAEIDQIEEIIARFVQSMPEVHPESTPSPKLHLLAAHLVPFLRVHKSWGRVTEQGIESLHSTFNKLFVRFAAVCDVELQAKLIMRQMTLYNIFFDVGDAWNDPPDDFYTF